MYWTLFDDNLDIVLGIEWRSWGVGPTIAIYGDINTYYFKLGPLYFSVTYWRFKEIIDDILNQG